MANANGFKRALIAILGVLTASCMHMTAAGFGLGAAILAHIHLFTAMKLLGALYLLWIGLQMWRHRGGGSVESNVIPIPKTHIYRRAFLISISNPKAIIPFMAVFTQFIQPEIPVTQQMVCLVPTALCIGACCLLFYASIGAGSRTYLKRPRSQSLLNRSLGSLYVLSGLALIFYEGPPKAEPVRP